MPGAVEAIKDFNVNLRDPGLDIGTGAAHLGNSGVTPTLADGSNAKGQWGYFRKRKFTPEGDVAPDSEYIFVGSTHPTDILNYIDMDCQPMRKYGAFEMQQKGWDPNKEPFRLLFIRGGAHEFPLAQLVEFKWHIRPPYRNVKFPQLDALPKSPSGTPIVPEASCTACRKKFCALTQVEADFLVGKHSSVMHQQTSQSEQLARNIAVVTTEMQGPMADVLKSILQGQQEQSQVNAGLIEALKGLSAAVGHLTAPTPAQTPTPTPTPVKQAAPAPTAPEK